MGGCAVATSVTRRRRELRVRRGSIGHVILPGGENVYCAEVEVSDHEHPAIPRLRCSAFRRTARRRSLWRHLVDGAATADELRSCGPRSPFMIPSRRVRRGSIAENPGKFLKHDLRQRLAIRERLGHQGVDRGGSESLLFFKKGGDEAIQSLLHFVCTLRGSVRARSRSGSRSHLDAAPTTSSCLASSRRSRVPPSGSMLPSLPRGGRQPAGRVIDG
jgi:hypothetical protein